MAIAPKDEPAPPRNHDRRAVLQEIREQLLEKIRLRYDVSAEEAEQRLRALEKED